MGAEGRLIQLAAPPRILTSDVEWRLVVQCRLFDCALHALGRSAVDGQIDHLVEGEDLHGVELPIVDGLQATGHTEAGSLNNVPASE